jgi:hypothetical protein
MRKRGAYFATAALSFIIFSSGPAAAFGFRIGPFHIGLPFGHRHHHHLYMRGEANNAGRHEQPQVTSGQVTWALVYPGRTLSAIFQNVLWPASASSWPFGYQEIFSTAFAPALAEPGSDQCRQSVDTNAMVERLRADIEPSPEQMAGLQRLGGAMAAASEYLAKACPSDIPEQPIARLRLMDSQIEILTMAVDMIHQPLEEFEDSLTPEQRARLGGEAKPASGASRAGHASLRACGGSDTAIDWSIDQIEKSVQPTDQQRPALSELQQAFDRAAGDLQAHCPTSVPQSAVARLETIEARLDATWRAILSIQVALNDFESQLSDEQKSRFKALTFASR